MNLNETAMPPPFISRLPGLRGGLSSRPEGNALKPERKLHYQLRAISTEEHDCDPVNFADILKEEFSYRTQARRFLWEFFD